jgi:peptidoglycan/xylan/chitin deacetylase (PgdA/CDA1 family)
MDAAAAAKTACWEFLGHLDQTLEFSELVPDESNAVLMYHSVGEPEQYGNVSPSRFRKTLTYLEETYEIVDLPEVLSGGSRKKVALTFDDGWENFYRHALPVLREFDVPATVFLVSEYIDSDPMLSISQIEELIQEPLVTIGNHTRTHPYLSRIGNHKALEDQILGAKEDLEQRFDITVSRFSYPRGDLTRKSAKLVYESHDIGTTTMPRVVSDRYLDEELGQALVPRIPGHVNESRLQWELTDASSRLRQFAADTDFISR